MSSVITVWEFAENYALDMEISVLVGLNYLCRLAFARNAICLGMWYPLCILFIRWRQGGNTVLRKCGYIFINDLKLLILFYAVSVPNIKLTIRIIHT